MTDADRAKLEAVVKEAKDKADEFRGTTRYDYWVARADRYNAELEAMGGDSDTRVAEQRNRS